MLRPLLLAFALASHASLASAQESQSQPAAEPVWIMPTPPGERVDIGGRRLHVLCKGPDTGATVIFEAGLSQYTASSTYGKAQDLIAERTKVCVYDRAGLGWSDPAPDPRDHRDMVEDLRKLNQALGLRGPLVLVGHSMGGMIARLYTQVYPDDVAAIVLVEASPESYIFAPGNAEGRKAIIAQIEQGLAKAKGDGPVVPMAAGTPAEVQLAFTPAVLRAVKQEYAAIDFAPAEWRSIGGYGTLGSRPLIVIRRGKTATPPSEADLDWQALQQSLLALSCDSELVVAENAGHVVPYDRPDIVAQAVERVIAKALAREPAPGSEPSACGNAIP